MPAAYAAAVLSLAAGNCSTCEGITYELDMSTTSGSKTASFTLTITGENTASDTQKGREAVEAFAFGDPAGDVSTAAVTSPAGYTFKDGGLSNSGGVGDCDMTGNFFCFHDPGISTASLLSGPLVFNFHRDDEDRRLVALRRHARRRSGLQDQLAGHQEQL